MKSPDIVWPSSNAYGIPDLLPEPQAQELTPPFEKWGDKSRAASMRGTYHFYTEDYKFSRLWSDPLQPVRAQPAALVEPNYSTGNGQPLSVTLWGLYRKRWLARFWQSCLVPIWVDLNVNLDVLEYALLGVPEGWRAYCTRGADSDYVSVLAHYEIARQHCGSEPLFLVYGGGSLTENLCLDRGWLFTSENMHVKEGRRSFGLQLRTMGVYL